MLLHLHRLELTRALNSLEINYHLCLILWGFFLTTEIMFYLFSDMAYRSHIESADRSGKFEQSYWEYAKTFGSHILGWLKRSRKGGWGKEADKCRLQQNWQTDKHIVKAKYSNVTINWYHFGKKNIACWCCCSLAP